MVKRNDYLEEEKVEFWEIRDWITDRDEINNKLTISFLRPMYNIHFSKYCHGIHILVFGLSSKF